MTGEVFWRRVANAARFLNDAVDDLLSGRSVVLNFHGNIPWRDVMLDVLYDKLLPCFNSRSLDIHSAPAYREPGEFLLESYFSESERNNYWAPSGSVEKFMAENPNSPLHHRFVFVTDITAERAKEWTASVSEYRKHCRDDGDHALFLLITENSSFTGSEHIAVHSYSDYISEYDCLLLCMNLLSEVKCSGRAKKYISELAVILAKGDLEYAGKLAEYGVTLCRNPQGTAMSVLHHMDKEVLMDHAEQSVWEAQIRIVYPELENYRRSFIKKHGSKFTKYLPVTDSAGEKITEVRDLELGQLFILSTNDRLLEKGEYDRLCNMRTVRNRLSHGDTVAYSELVSYGLL